jgi:dTMP kinase
MDSDRTNKFAGRFIVLDGPDGAGKSTQIPALEKWLTEQGVRVVRAHDPGGTAIGDRIRHVLLDGNNTEMTVACETLLYMASRAQLVSEVIRPALEKGTCVLCDRYVSSTIAYQGAGGTDSDEIRSLAQFATGGLWPDLTVIIDVPAGAGLERLTDSPDRMESKGRRFHEAVRQAFLDQAAEDPLRFEVVDGSGSPASVQEQIVETLQRWKPTKSRRG